MTFMFRPLQQTDEPLLQTMYQDARLMQFIANPSDIHVPTLVSAMLQAMSVPTPVFHYWVVEQAGHSLGVVSATHLDWQHRHAELGIMLLPAHHARGVAKRVFLQLLDQMFQLDLDWLYSRMLPTNLPARRLVRQCGMQPCQAPYDKNQAMFWVKIGRHAHQHHRSAAETRRRGDVVSDA